MHRSSADSPETREWVFTGRDTELARAAVALHPASGWAGMALVGPPGVGKTRLAREALTRAEVSGFTVEWVAATDSARELPLGAFAGLLDPPSASDVLSSPTAFVGFAMHQLGQSGRRLVLGVDDVHLLDDVSALLLQQLVLRRSAQVLVTFRSGLDVPDAVASLLKDDLIGRLDLAALSDTSIDHLVDAVLAAPVDRSTRTELHRLSQGNPFYLRQLVDGGIQDGSLVFRDGVWQRVGGVVLPATLSDVVTRRLEKVSDETGLLLDYLALAEPLDTALIALLVDPTTIELAENRGVIVVDQGPADALTVRYAHPLFAEARRAGLGTVYSRRLKGQLAAAMADPRSRHSHDVLRRALLEIEADSEPSLELLLSALRRAAELVDIPLAYRLARASLRAGAGFDTQAYLANLAALIPGANPRAELDRLAALASNDLERSRAAVMRIAHFAWETNDPEAAEAEVAQSVAALTDPRAVAHVEAMDALLLAQRGRPDAAIAVGERLLNDRQLEGDAAILATSGLVAGRAGIGKVDGLSPLIDRALTHPSVLGSGAFRTPLIATHALGLILAGYLNDAQEVIRRFTDGVRNAGPVNAVAACLLGRMELALGRPRTALPLLIEARSGFAYFGGWRYLNQIALTHAMALGGTLDAADTARRELDEHVHPTMRFWEPDRLIADALVTSRHGAITDALALCGEAAEVARRFGQHANEVVALQQLHHFGIATGLDRLRALARLVDGPRVQLAFAHSAALATSDPLALGEVSEGWENCGDMVSAAEAAAQSWRLAAGRTGLANRRLAAAAQRRAAGLIVRSENPRTPELDAFTRPLPLTSREREVVALAGHGLSNREIATRLHVSVRTVEGHIYRATAKLGTTREGFATLIEP